MISLIPRDIAIELRDPEFLTGFRSSRELAGWVWMTVPETAVNEESDTPRPEHNVRPSGEFSCLQAEAQTCRMERPSYAKLGFGVPPPHTPHLFRPGEWLARYLSASR